MKIAVASTNPGKAREIGDLLRDVADVVPAAGVAYPPEGDDYAANAVAKARAAAAATGRPAVADDSGLEIEAFASWPGPISARIGATDAERRAVVLRRLASLGCAKGGRARFVCVAAVAWPDGRTATFRGEWAGRIVAEERGAGGFGYDSIFEDPETGKTAAEMTPEEKAARSHRGKAFRALAERLRQADLA
jgi:XTP/dITP diphosphohydrolase